MPFAAFDLVTGGNRGLEPGHQLQRVTIPFSASDLVTRSIDGSVTPYFGDHLLQFPSAPLIS